MFLSQPKPYTCRNKFCFLRFGYRLAKSLLTHNSSPLDLTLLKRNDIHKSYTKELLYHICLLLCYICFFTKFAQSSMNVRFFESNVWLKLSGNSRIIVGSLLQSSSDDFVLMQCKKVRQFKIGLKPFNWQWTDIKNFNWIFRTHIQCSSSAVKHVHHQQFTADDEHCLCDRNIQLKFFISVHCQLKGFSPILNCFTFVMERQVFEVIYAVQKEINSDSE